MPRRTFTAIAIGLTALLAAAQAQARPISKADRAVVKTGLAHIAAMTTILDKWMKSPKRALDELERYVTKNRKQIIQLKRESDRIREELDSSARDEWQRITSGAPETMRLMRTVMTFWSKHHKNRAALKRMKRLLSSVRPSSKPPARGKQGSKDKKK